MYERCLHWVICRCALLFRSGRGNTRKRIAGLRLVAQDVEWAHGHGPDVCGSGEAVMLVLTGRPVGPGELTGPGAAELYARL